MADFGTCPVCSSLGERFQSLWPLMPNGTLALHLSHLQSGLCSGSGQKPEELLKEASLDG